MKLVINEQQLKKLYLYNQILNESTGGVLSILDLANIIGRLGFDKDSIGFIHKMLINSYKHSGDEGVCSTFKEMTELDLEPISHGKYIFSYK